MMSPFYMVTKARVKALKDLGGDNGAGKKRASNGDDADSGGKKGRRSNEDEPEDDDADDAGDADAEDE